MLVTRADGIIIPGLPRISVIELEGWNVQDKAFYLKVKGLLAKPTIVFIDGPIGGGKSELAKYFEYWHSKDPNPRPSKFRPEPIDEIRAITKKYYSKDPSDTELGDVNKQISDCCLSKWLPEVTAANSHLEYDMYIERLPPPFRSDVFKRGFNTNMELEISRTLTYAKVDLAQVFEAYMKGRIILDTIRAYPPLMQCVHVLLIFVCPPPERVLKQIKERGREEEKVLSLGYSTYLISRFKKASWELLTRHKTQWTCSQDTVEKLAIEYPL